MINKYFKGEIKEYPQSISELDKQIEEFSNEIITEVEKNFETTHISNAINETWNLVARTNKYIDETAPWVLYKEEKTEELRSVMYHLVENLRRIAIIISPYMVHTSRKMLEQLSIPKDLQTWNSLSEYNKIKNLKVIEKPEVLFARLEQEVEIEEIKKMMK